MGGNGALRLVDLGLQTHGTKERFSVVGVDGRSSHRGFGLALSSLAVHPGLSFKPVGLSALFATPLAPRTES